MSNEEMLSRTELEARKGGVGETIRFIIISLLLVFTIRHFIAQPFIVSGDSMVPTFEDGQYLIVDQLSYRFGEPTRYDVIIMRYPLEPKKYFIKRIIGLPGETLSFNGDVITVTPRDGSTDITLEEPFVKNKKGGYFTVTLKNDEYYVLGDNRAASLDSRSWGPLPAENIIGKPLVRLFPLTAISLKPGSFDQSTN